MDGFARPEHLLFILFFTLEINTTSIETADILLWVLDWTYGEK